MCKKKIHIQPNYVVTIWLIIFRNVCVWVFPWVFMEKKNRWKKFDRRKTKFRWTSHVCDVSWCRRQRRKTKDWCTERCLLTIEYQLKSMDSFSRVTTMSGTKNNLETERKINSNLHLCIIFNQLICDAFFNYCLPFA